MSDYSDILNRKKTSDKLGDAFSKQADSMRPLNVGQRREQALLRGLGVGLNNDDEREAKLAELEEDYKQVDMFDRQLKMATAKNQLKEQKIKSFIADQDSNLKLASDLIVKGKYDQLDILAPSIFNAYKENTGTNLGEYLFSKNGHISFKTPDGKIETMEAKTLFNPIMNYIPPEDRGNYKGFATSYQAEELDAIVETRRLKNEYTQSQINSANASVETSKAHADLYKAQSNPDSIQAEIDYKKAQANLLNQKVNNVGSGDNKKLFDEIYKTNVNYLSEAKTNIENNKKVLGAYDNIGTILSEENADTFTRTGPSIKAAALRFLNPSFDEGTRREAELEMESQPLYLDLKKLFGFNPSNTDIALFIKTLPTMGKDYKANMNAINRRKEEIKKDIFKTEETRKLIEESNYKLLHSHSSIDEIVNNRWDKKVLIDKGKVKLKLKDGSISILDKEKDSKEINNLVSKGLGEIIE